jgi:hypothetical protein
MTFSFSCIALLKLVSIRDARPFVYSRNRKIFRRQLDAYERYIRQRRIPRHSLLSVSRSPWRRVFASRDDQAMITLTGFGMESFNYLVNLFAPVYDHYSPYVNKDGYIVRKKSLTKGRPRMLNPADCLGLVLAWSRTRGSLMVLQLLFGMTMSPVGKYLQFARRILVKILKNDDLAKIKVPSVQRLEEYRAMIADRHPALDMVWGTMDGLKCRIEKAPDEIVQSRFYNGWKSDHYVCAVLCFVPDGTIATGFYNVPGCCHDSTIADWGEIYDKLGKVYEETGFKLVIDSAFASGTYEFLIKSSQDDLTADEELLTLDEQRANIAVKRAATSMRQSAEWGMAAVQSSFPRLRDTLVYEENGERRIIFNCLFHLYNLRARLVGINQIANVYLPALDHDANVQFING